MRARYVPRRPVGRSDRWTTQIGRESYRSIDERTAAAGLRVAIRLGPADAVSLQLQDERAARHVQLRRGGRLIPSAAIEDLDDSLPLFALCRRPVFVLRTRWLGLDGAGVGLVGG